MAEPQVSFAIVARDAAGKVLADVQLDLEKVAQRAEKVGGGFTALGGAAEGGTHGLRKMEQGIQALAAQAAGVEGPIGKVLEGALAFGVGGVAVAGFAAGFLVMRAALDKLGESAKEADDRLLSLRQEAEKLSRTPLMNAVATQKTTQNDLIEARKKLAEIEKVPENVRNKDEERARQQRVDELEKLLATFDKNVTKILADDADKTADAVTEFFQHVGQMVADKAAELKKKWEELVARQLKTEAANPFGVLLDEDVRRQASQNFLNSVGPRTPLTVSAGHLAEIESIRQQAAAQQFNQAAGVKDAADGFSQAATVTIAAFGAMAEAAISGSDQMATAMISGITQIVQAAIAAQKAALGSAAGPLGAIVGVVGGIVGLAVGRHHDAAPVNIEEVSNEAARKIADATQPPPPQPIVIFGDRAGAEQAADALMRQTQRDRSPRIPRGVSPSLLNTGAY